MVRSSLALVQDGDCWRKMPVIAPIQVFNSTIRKVVTARSAVPMRARSGPSLSLNCLVSALPYKLGEQVMCCGQIVLDGGWVFYQVKRRYYGNPKIERDAHGWLCTRDKDY